MCVYLLTVAIFIYFYFYDSRHESVNVILEIAALTKALQEYIVFMVSLIEERMNIICGFAIFIACYLSGSKHKACKPYYYEVYLSPFAY